MASTEASRLQALEDREAIRELQATYCFLVDDERIDELVDRCFAEDARCDFRLTASGMDPLIAEGHQEIRAFFRDAVCGLLREMNHTVHNQRLAVEGDRASADCYFELTALDASSGEAILGGGRYIDHFRRVDDAWRFQERRAEIRYLSPLREGWDRQRFLRVLTAAASAST
jgi:ketosteroid isomerase-like protein